MSGTYAGTALIAVGANLGFGGVPPAEGVARAMVAVAEAVAQQGAATGTATGAAAGAGGQGTRHSALYATPAFPPGAGPDFVNAAMAVDWSGPAEALLALLHGIEARMGRRRRARWEARVMDLDLIALGAAVLPDAATRARWAALPPEAAARVAPDRLILPHPRLAERAFVLVPLAEVAPGWTDPATGLTVEAMLAALPPAEVAAVRRMA